MMHCFPAILLLLVSCPQLPAQLPTTTEELFQADRIWSIDLSLSKQDWDALQPDMSTAMTSSCWSSNEAGACWIGSLDQDRDATITRSEFTNGLSRWYRDWDTNHQGTLSIRDLRAGINRQLVSPDLAILKAPERHRNGMLGIGGIHFDYVHSALEVEGIMLGDVALRYKGNGTYLAAAATEKKPLKIDLDKFVKGQQMAGISKLNLHNNINDPSFMRETLAYELYRSAGVPSLRTAYAGVTLNVTGAQSNHYLGLYTMVESPDKEWAEHAFNTRDGAILKPDTHELFKYRGTDWARYDQEYDPKTELSPKHKQRVYEFSTLLTFADDLEFERRLPDFLDIDEFSRFLAVTVWLSSTDSILMMGHNLLLYLQPDTSRFLFVPWDLDRAFGNFFGDSMERMSIRKAWADDNRFLERVMKVPAVKEAYLARMREFQGTLFNPESLDNRVDSLATVIRHVVEREEGHTLESFDHAVSSSNLSEPGVMPGQIGVTALPIKAFVHARHQSVDYQLEGKTEGLSPVPSIPRALRQARRPADEKRTIGVDVFVTQVARALFNAGDSNNDDALSAQEFTILADSWYAGWDTSQGGTLATGDIIANLSTMVLSYSPQE